MRTAPSALIATLPQSRRRIVAEKFATLCLQAVPAARVTMLCMLAGPGFQLHIGIGALIGTTIGVLLLAIDFGAMAMLIGAATGSRGTALGVTSTVAAAVYIHQLARVRGALDTPAPVRLAVLLRRRRRATRPRTERRLGRLLAGVAIILAMAAAAAFDGLDVHSPGYRRMAGSAPELFSGESSEQHGDGSETGGSSSTPATPRRRPRMVTDRDVRASRRSGALWQSQRRRPVAARQARGG